MFDFIDIRVLVKKPGKVVIYPEFINGKNKDLMIRGGDFYAFWDEAAGFWKTDQNELIEQIDKLTLDFANEYIKTHEGESVSTALLKYNSSGKWAEWVRFRKNCNDNYNELDRKVIFSNEHVSKKDYVTKTLPYPIVKQDISAYEELMDVLYDKSEREKIEWAIGSIITGECVDIQKFYVLYGAAGTGKSTVLTIIQDMFEGYWKPFVSADLGNASAQFAMESLKDNPIIAIEHDGDLSRIDSNARLNSIISHEPMIMNEKRKNQYQITIKSVMFIGTNKPVRITDSKSGLLRRLIDISPSGRRLSFDKYQELMAKIAFEYGGIAYHCKEVYEKSGMSKYLKYRPTIMIDETNDMYNFVQEMLWDWEATDKVTLASAWQDYQKWVEDANTYKMKKRTFKSELKDYFNEFHERLGQEKYVYVGIKKDKFSYVDDDDISQVGDDWLDLKEGIKSKVDKDCANCYAQYATDDEIPGKSWKSVTSRLRELDTSKLHYVKVPENHIVIDFDIKNEKGEKDFILNMRAASKFPKTYAEVSKGGQGIHLHYIYTGDVSKLSSIYDADIEVKVFRGGASLRRKLTKCNDIPIATIGSGLPLKEEKPMVSKKAIESERHLIAMVKKCLNKEHHGHTAPEVDFIKHLTDQAYTTEGLSFDIRSMKPALVSFAMSSTNQAQKCFNTVSTMHLCSKDVEENEVIYSEKVGDDEWSKAPIVFFDVEVFPNLFIICWKIAGSENVNAMVNPTPKETEELFKYRLVGFNNRAYDNHIIYARAMGYSIMELYNLSKKIISGETVNAGFGSAYNLSYTDVHDYATNKQSLKKWEIDLDIFHLENAHPWDKPVDEKYWDEIVEYCKNDVRATEAVWNATQNEFQVREVIAKVSGLSVNEPNRKHIISIILGGDKKIDHVYTDLATGEVLG